MQKQATLVVARDNIEGVVDLRDFPHGRLLNVRKDDKYDIEFYEVPDGIKVPSYNPASGCVEWMPVACWSVHRGKKTEIVTLSDGSQIYTDDDPRAIYGVAADAETLEPQRFTPTQAQAKRVLVPITTDSLAGDIPQSWYDFDTGLIGNAPTEHSASVGFSFGQFIGIMVGDGWVDTAIQAYLADNEGYNLKFVSDFLGVVYGGAFRTVEYVQRKEESADRYGDTKRYRLVAGTRDLGRRVKELVDGHGDASTSGSANKHLPLWYQFAGREFLEGLVCGMVATDGTVAVSHGKAKPQLQIQYTSTSLRLAREFQRCCRLLGCRCSVSLSKHTSGGNIAWLCIVSTVDAKRTGLLRRCCNDRKRSTFEATPVETVGANVRNDVIPFPKDVAAELVACIPAVQHPETDDEREQYSLCLNVRARAKEGVISRQLVRRACEIGVRLAERAESARASAMSALGAVRLALSTAVGRSARETSVAVDSSVADVLRDGVRACQTRTGDKKVAGKQLTMLYSVRTKGRMTVAQADGLAEFFLATPAQTDLRDSHALAQLVMLAESDVRWESIDRVERTGVEEIGYDLTVPGYDTFVNADGVVLSNTMNFHVPSSDKAVQEAIEKMLPSKNLFSTTDLRSPRYVPMMEMTLGLARLTAPASKAKPRVFVTARDAIRAYRRGEIGANDPVSVLRA